nr:hypothetical protein [Candidatus Sigynarchaeota archaeon]
MAKITLWQIIHWIIIGNFLFEIGYCIVQVFVVFSYGSFFPLFGSALTMDIDFFLKRRLYAIESWIAISGLAIYLAITEILPRKRKAEKALRNQGDDKSESSSP